MLRFRMGCADNKKTAPAIKKKPTKTRTYALTDGLVKHYTPLQLNVEHLRTYVKLMFRTCVKHMFLNSCLTFVKIPRMIHI